MKGWEKALVAALVVVVIILAVFYLMAYTLDTIVPNWLFMPGPNKKAAFVPGGLTYGHPPPAQRRAPIPRRA